jgi:hypothetical protein
MIPSREGNPVIAGGCLPWRRGSELARGLSGLYLGDTFDGPRVRAPAAVCSGVAGAVAPGETLRPVSPGTRVLPGPVQGCGTPPPERWCGPLEASAPGR